MGKSLKTEDVEEDLKREGNFTWIWKYQQDLYEERGKGNPGPVPEGAKAWSRECAGCIYLEMS